MQIRPIQASDNDEIGHLIQRVLEEHKANVPGTAYFDKQLFKLSEVYQAENAVYYVIEENNEIMGGAGINVLEGGDPSVCELQKIYLKQEGRGKGWGRMLIEKCLDFAENRNYSSCYLETMPELSKGIELYKKVGFVSIEKPLGDTSHHGCSIWMLKQLS
ncbi:GNAT family N-acetyltransferase [Flammeovirga aprica]|uniref:GNAT family N-acetyltransferase n=1 Tax=Flammeovirga aprica JL-4 TaxID=694437 RepID=A0A7X9RVE3_9BACT|nr:GNAT family N-acetyltransferase [Flammeovirga aprica]NME69406.1 GNAT family N-acetyltransferase [Flammeovirga aprica JL-4]